MSDPAFCSKSIEWLELPVYLKYIFPFSLDMLYVSYIVTLKIIFVLYLNFQLFEPLVFCMGLLNPYLFNPSLTGVSVCP